MSLRLRRGTDAERTSVVFAEGEVVYTTDTKLVYVGDGVTQGGVNLVANASEVPPNSITIEKLAVSDGTAGQVLSTDGSGNLAFVDAVTGEIVIPENSVGATELAVATGTANQVLSIDGAGNLQFIDAVLSINEGSISIVELAVTDGTAGQVLTTDGNGVLSFTDVITSIPPSSIGVNELIVTPGTANQVLSIDGAGNLQFIDAVLSINEGSISILELAVTDGTAGQVLTTNGQGGLYFSSIPGVSGDISVDNISALSLTVNNVSALSVTAASFDGDLKGSVFSDNSSVLVDSITSTLNTSLLSLSGNTISSSTSNVVIDTFGGVSISSDVPSVAKLSGLYNGTDIPQVDIRASRGTNESPATINAGDYGTSLAFTTYDPVGQEAYSKSIAAFIPQLDATAVNTEDAPKSNLILTVGAGDTNGEDPTGNYMYWSWGGNGSFNTKSVEFRAQDATSIGNMTPVAGTIIFDSDTQKFKGYVDDTGLAAGGAPNSTPGWVELN